MNHRINVAKGSEGKETQKCEDMKLEALNETKVTLRIYVDV